jgi:hypothetical protein
MDKFEEILVKHMLMHHTHKDHVYYLCNLVHVYQNSAVFKCSGCGEEISIGFTAHYCEKHDDKK